MFLDVHGGYGGYGTCSVGFGGPGGNGGEISWPVGSLGGLRQPDFSGGIGGASCLFPKSPDGKDGAIHPY